MWFGAVFISKIKTSRNPNANWESESWCASVCVDMRAGKEEVKRGMSPVSVWTSGLFTGQDSAHTHTHRHTHTHGSLQHLAPCSTATVGRLLVQIAMETRSPGRPLLYVCACMCVKDGERRSGMPPFTQCPAECVASCLADWKGVFKHTSVHECDLCAFSTSVFFFFCRLLSLVL